METNIIPTETNPDAFHVIITGISWNKNAINAYRSKKNDSELPDQFDLELPENVLNQASKPKNNFNDIVETYVYNFLTRKFGHEVYSCSIWLPPTENIGE